MKRIALSILLFFTLDCFCQTIVSGRYSNGLSLAYDSSTNLLTGYYENYTGMNADNSAPLFSCIFYFVGNVNGVDVTIRSHYPNDVQVIQGNLKIIGENEVAIYLNEEHGGCFNVRHFNEEPTRFTLEEKVDWKQIRYVVSQKSYIYKGKRESDKSKAFLIEKDLFFISMKAGDWSYGIYYGDKESKGWLKNNDLNTIDEKSLSK